MNGPRFIFVLVVLVMIGGAIGFYLSTQQPAEFAPPPASTASEESVPPRPAAAQPTAEEPAAAPEAVPEAVAEFPPGAIAGEYVIHFTNREDYLAYLAALKAAGQRPLSQIDQLMAVRIPQEALRTVDLRRHGAQADYAYEVERPLPPVEIDPEALAALRAFGQSAREIVGGVLQGDGSGVKIGVLDSGIQSHAQFDGLSIEHIDLTGDGVASAGAAHGTSVASILAGKEGIVPHSELVVLRVLNEEGLGNSFHVAEGIVAAVDRGVNIINLSLGVYQDSPVLRQAVDYAHQNGVVLVAAAGNDGHGRLPYPAAYDRVLSVTAVDANGSHAVFPNQSNQIDFAAPGVGVLTAEEDEGTMYFSGTSAAAPFVSGTLASLMSGDAALSASDAVDVLRRHLNDAGAPGTDPAYGGGVVDWDRLRERDTPGIVDVALAGIHLSPEALPGTNMPVEVTVQNRGTKWLNEARLEVFVDESEPIRFTVGTLGPGETTTRRVHAQVPSHASERALNIAATVVPEDLNQDVRLENNFKAVQFRPR